MRFTLARVSLALVGLIVLPALLVGCDKTDVPVRCNLPTGESTCVSDRQCDDAVYCNGIERCEPGNPSASSCGCVRKAAEIPCVQDGYTCDESAARCHNTACDGYGGDVDGDGHSSVACGGDDCDDNDARRYPGNPEVCDAEDLDEDCNPATFGDRDADRDGFVDAACCNNEGGMACGDDCNDSQPSIHPTNPEVCNQIDDDCDGIVDEEVTIPLYVDADGDGFGTGDATQGCDGFTIGTSTLDGDCDDTTPSIFPGMFRCTSKATEVEYCDPSGWTLKYCPAQTVCVPQPGGWGACS
jgi:hypothetical protein